MRSKAKFFFVICLALLTCAMASPAAGEAAKAKGGLTKGPATAAPKAGLMDINTASREELSSLPGIDAAYAQRIIDHRPYKKKDQLRTKRILPDNVYEKVKDRIIAKQGPQKR